MATVKIDQFGGIAPRQHPTQLADGMAVAAMNVVLENGKLVPLRQPRMVENTTNHMESGLADVADAQSMHVWRKEDGSFDFLLFKGVTWAAPGNIAADDLTRIVVSGDRDGDGKTDEPVVYMRDSVTKQKVVYPIAKYPVGYDEADRPEGIYPVVSRVDGVLPVADVDMVLKGYKTVAEINAMAAEDLTKGWSYILTDDGDITLGGITAVANTRIVWNGTAWAFASESNITSDVRYTRFFYTWFDKYGMESPPGLPSRIPNPAYDPETPGSTEHLDEELQYLDGDEILFAAIGTENMPALAVGIRIYKVVAGTSEARIQFVKEVSADEINGGSSAFSFAVKDENAGEIMPEIETPPRDLTCICNVPGSFYAGFSPSAPKTVCFSDIDLLYSWPIAYRYDVADNLVALAVTSNSVFALTDGWPYVFTGTAPESMTVAKLASPAACVSPRGVCVLRNTVFFASNRGLMAISNSANEGTIVTNITEQVFTKDQWLALNPSTCLLGNEKGRLFMYFAAPDGETYADGTTHKGLIFNFTEGLSVALTRHDEAARCLALDHATDKMYFVREGV